MKRYKRYFMGTVPPGVLLACIPYPTEYEIANALGRAYNGLGLSHLDAAAQAHQSRGRSFCDV